MNIKTTLLRLYFTVICLLSISTISTPLVFSQVLGYANHAELKLNIFSDSKEYIEVSFENKQLFKSREQLLLLRRYLKSYRVISLNPILSGENEKNKISFGSIIKIPNSLILNLENIDFPIAIFVSGVEKQEENVCFKPLRFWNEQTEFPTIFIPAPSGKISQTNDPKTIKNIINARSSFISEYVKFQLNIEERCLRESKLIDAGFSISLMATSNNKIDSFLTFGELSEIFQNAVIKRNLAEISLLTTLLTSINDRICKN